MEKFKDKYRVESNRMPDWDYGWNAPYFITICTQNRVFYFGDIVETRCIASNSETRCIASNSETRCIASLRLSEIGKIVESEWLKTPIMRPDMNLQLGEYIIMPNHFHAIISIGENIYNRDDGDRSITTNRFAPQSKNLASIIRGFKSSVTMNARKIDPGFAWQPRFYDRIIRDDDAYRTIAAYIRDNPCKWIEDRLHNKT